MPNTLSTPWDFANAGKQFSSPDASQCLTFAETGETGQGGPVRGEYCWISADGRVTKLPGEYGGPPVWEASGRRVALPCWVDSMLGGATQRLALLDCTSRKLLLLQKRFRVLQLQSFDNTVVTATDSPIHHPSPVLIQVDTAAIKHVFGL